MGLQLKLLRLLLFVLVASALPAAGCPNKKNFDSYLNSLYCLLTSRAAKEENSFKAPKLNYFTSFLKEMEKHDLCLENPKLTEDQVKDLEALVVTTTQNQEQECKDNDETLVMKGIFVELLDLKPFFCHGKKVKRVNIFSTQTVYIRGNLNLEDNTYYNIFAPQWSLAEVPNFTGKGKFLGIAQAGPNEQLVLRHGAHSFHNETSNGIIFFQSSKERDTGNFKNATSDYRKYLRDNLRNATLRARILSFLTTMDNNPAFRKDYDLEDFLSDIKHLEVLFRDLYESVNFFPFFNSLLEDITAKLSDTDITDDDKEIFKFLYLAVLVRSCAAKENKYADLVIDMQTFARATLGNLKHLQKSIALSQSLNETYNHQEQVNERLHTQIELITNYKTKYVNYYTTKIEVAKEQIDLFNGEMDRRISQMQNETKNLQHEIERIENDALGYVENLHDKRKTLQQLVVKERLANTLKGFSKMFNFFGLGGLFAGMLINGVVDMLESETANIKVNNTGDTAFAKPPISKESLESIKEFRDQVSTECNTSTNSRSKRQSDAQDLLDVTDTQIKQTNQHIEVLQYLRQNICDTVEPLIKSVKDDLQNYSGKVKNFTGIQLVYANWEMNRKLTKIRRFIDDSYGTFENASYITIRLKELAEIVECTTAIFRIIDSYRDRMSVALLPSEFKEIDLESRIKNPDIDEKRKKALLELNIYFASNIIQMEYKSFVYALKQYLFPNAETYLNKANIPTETFIDNGTEMTISQINTFTSLLSRENYTITKDDNVKFTDAHFDPKGKGGKPFYIWNDTDKIVEILKGKKVVLVADIEKSNEKYNAVKFKTIRLEFRIKDNIDAEKALNDLLKPWSFKMTHFGNSYYKCGGGLYRISSNMTILDFPANPNGTGAEVANESYNKLSKGNYVLSPYATWEVQLRNEKHLAIPASLIEMVAKGIEMQLVGLGQYCDVCDYKNLEKHYEMVGKQEEDHRKDSSEPKMCVEAETPIIHLTEIDGILVQEVSNNRG